MLFTELVLINFGPYAGKNVINLRTKTDGTSRPIILIGGMNGGGKTTLMDAIRLALYGQRAQCSTRNSLSYTDFLIQAINNQTPLGEKTRIELAFEHFIDDEWKELRIVRSWDKQPKDGKDILGILDTDWPDKALADTWDEYIETLLPLGISNLFLFDGEQVKELAEQETPPPSVIEAIQSLLGLELVERLAVDLEVLVGRKRKNLASQSQLKTIEEIENKLNHYQQELEDAKQEHSSVDNQLKRAQTKFKEASERFRIEGGKIASESSSLKTTIDELKEKIQQQRDEMVSLATTNLPLALISPLLNQAKDQGSAEIKQQQATIAKTVLQQRDQKLLSYLETLKLSQDKLEKIQTFLDQEYETLNQASQVDISLILGITEDELTQLNTLLDHQLPLQLDNAQKYLKNLQNLEINLDNNERKLQVAASPEDYQKLSDALTATQKEVGKIQSDYNTAERRVREADKAISMTRKELKSYTDEAIDKQNNEHIIQSAAKVQNTLQLFKERLTLKKLNKLEGEVTECFRYLLHKSDLVHRVAIDTHNFGLSLYDPNGNTVPKHRLSAGEKQLLSIAFLWGLARVSGRNLPIAIDTPLGRLDSSHRNNLVERYFPTASEQVILLSTDTEIREKELKQLQEQDAIAHQYLLEYNANNRQTTIHPDRYFW
ncbi:DNA sulfur modification protein DndD [Crocosphaera sp. UHCC 0190]|uniref:DNA sulfur modification protein DndD n=1 Tax=Crocosphaera sp. UHCC 0190 TaxID=3110246 RepID=UPI002B202029|nr:DNA sulfur modification protein DndD [Crocosphaera sp. UHCC 0190]MEA5512061.1 DNA sulfur modification protein DndD [Crocosphaera sp. UHCC 0190]